MGTSDTLSVQNDMLVGLHVATNLQMYLQNSEKVLWGYANGWQCQRSRYYYLAGNLRASRKLKQLVCLVVFLC